MNKKELFDYACNIFGINHKKQRIHCPIHDPNKKHEKTFYALGENFYCQNASCKKLWFPDKILQELNISFDYEYKKLTKEEVKADKKEQQAKLKLKHAKEIKAQKAEIKLLLEQSIPINDSQQELLNFLWHWRGWTIEVIKKCKLRFLPRKNLYNLRKLKRWLWWLDKSSGGWILIPYFNARGETVYIKGRQLTTSKVKKYKSINIKGSVSIPYNYHSLDKTKEIWIFEGEQDVISAISMGYNACGCSSTDLKKSWLHLFKDLKVKLCFDIDDAGRIGANKASKELKHHCSELKILNKLPKGKDFNEFVLSLLPVDDNKRIILPEPLFESWINADDSQRESMLERLCIMRTEGINEQEIANHLKEIQIS